MKVKFSLTPFQAFLVAVQLHAILAAYSGTSRGHSQYAERERNWSSSVEKDKDKGYKITIKLDEAFGKAAEDLELIRELSVDLKLIKVLLEDIVPDIKELRRSLPGYVEGASPLSSDYGYGRRYQSNISRLLSSNSSAYRPSEYVAEVALLKSNCAELKRRGQQRSAVYNIQPDRNLDAFEAYCDMTTDGGGWTVIQRRGALDIPKIRRESFYRNWYDYQDGFGNVRSDYWLGLENIHSLTKDCNNELIVNITSWDGASKFARYAKFNISGSSDKYRLNIANYSGNAGDGLLQHNKMQFTTYDKQNDLNGEENCAELYKGAWWYKDCFWSNLNGEYADDGTDGKMASRSGIEWSSRHFYSNMKTEMKIRPQC